MNHITHIAFHAYSETDISGISIENIEKINIEITAILSKYTMHSSGYESLTLHKKKNAIERCETCNSYMVNRDTNPIGIEEVFMYKFIRNGGNQEGKKLCEYCLPEEHRWS